MADKKPTKAAKDKAEVARAEADQAAKNYLADMYVDAYNAALSRELADRGIED